MEPIRDPAIARMSWEGWTFLGNGQLQDGGELRLADPRAVIAWRQLCRRDKALLDAGSQLPAARPLPPTGS